MQQIKRNSRNKFYQIQTDKNKNCHIPNNFDQRYQKENCCHQLKFNNDECEKN